MKKWFICCIAALSIAPAFAVEWQYLNGNQALGFGNNTDGNLDEIDLSSVKLKKGILHFWMRSSYLPERNLAGVIGVKSQLVEYAGDCKENEIGAIQMITYDDLRGTGKQLISNNTKPDLTSVVPGSVGEFALDIACRIAGQRK